MHDAAMAEFGASLVDESVEADTSREEVDPEISSGTTGHEIELEEAQPRRQSAGILDA